MILKSEKVATPLTAATVVDPASVPAPGLMQLQALSRNNAEFGFFQGTPDHQFNVQRAPRPLAPSRYPSSSSSSWTRCAPTIWRGSRTSGRGAYNRIYRSGTVFEHGEQDHAATETAPGHATLLSGRYPAHTGIVLNSRGVQDPDAPLVGHSGGEGASPRRFRGTTLVDWMLARDPATRVLSVSRKDRGAIFPVGRAKVPVY